MFQKIPKNVPEHSKNVPENFGNVAEDSGECSKRFRGMFKKIQGMYERIPGNLNLDLFCEILLVFYEILLLNSEKTKEYFLRY